MPANHPPPYDFSQMVQMVQQEWQAAIRQETEEVGHVHEAALLGQCPHQRWPHSPRTFFGCDRISDFVKQERGGGWGPFNLKLISADRNWILFMKFFKIDR